MTAADGWALIFLAIYAIAAGAAVYLQARRTAETWPVWVLHVIARCYCPLMFQLRLRQHCTLPVEGAALLIANHRSPVDPMLVFSSCSRRRDGYRIRPVEFLTATEYTTLGGFVGFVCRHMRAIPVDRDGRDMESAKDALRRLQRGRIVGIFPEGRINTDAGLLPGNPGVAWLALKGHCPVIPVYLSGIRGSGSMTAPFHTFCRARVSYGDPMDLTAFAQQRVTPELLDRVTEFIMCRLAEAGGISRRSLRVVTDVASAAARESA